MSAHLKRSDPPSESENREPEEVNSAVGYGRPPRHSQFKPGTSGNPKGRTKGSRNLKSVRKEIYEQLVSMRIGGKHQLLPIVTALDVALINKALKGDVKAISAAQANAKELGVCEPASSDCNVLSDFAMSRMPREELMVIIHAEEIKNRYKSVGK